jgi:uncharacterized protein (DUF885 family)
VRFSRRALMGGVAALVAVPTEAARKKRRMRPLRPAPPVKALPAPTIGPFEEITDRLLVNFRETATYNGTPDALNGGTLARKLDDYSPAGEASSRGAIRWGRDLLTRIRFGDAASIAYLPTISAILENGARSAGIPYGRLNPLNFSGHVPYLVSQLAGPHIDSVNVMMEQQSLASAPAVDAWIEKLDGFPAAFDGVVEKLASDSAAGCHPPRILMEKVVPVLDAFLHGKAQQHPLIAALDRRTNEAGLSFRIRNAAHKRALTSLDRRARPAFEKLRKHLLTMIPEGRTDSGVWAQPQGDEFYAANVRTLGDTLLSPDEIHTIGLDEVKRISTEMNTLLAARGLSQGSIGARMLALAKDPTNQFANSDAGRAQLLDYVRAKVRWAESLYPRLLPKAMIPRQSLTVKRVPVATQASAPGGFYDGPSLDGSRPGIYWINLRDMAAVARFRLPTLSFHEGVPGHHTQGSVAAALGSAPMLVRIASFNAYQEGWALYGERLMAELGAYKEDALGNLGRLQDELFRAVRLVVDTGLHHKRWTREAAIAWMLDATGIAETRVTAEIERYMAWPGQALGYKLGQLRLLELRKAYRAAHGEGADLRAFHGAVLGGGAMPLDLIEQRVAAIAHR